MRRITLILFVAIQAIYFAGAVCGPNLSAAKSMACCKEGQMGNMPMHGSSACCSHCDMGKSKSVVKLHRGIPKEFKVAQPSSGIPGKAIFDSFFSFELHLNNSSHRPSFTASSPPCFVLNEQFLI